MRSSLPVMWLALGWLALAACGGDKPKSTESEPPSVPKGTTEAPEPPKPQAEPAAKAPEAPTEPAPDRTLTPDAEGIVRLTGDDSMHYNADRIEVPADKPIKIELEHVGKLPAAAMGHNVVILKQGLDPMAFATAAMNAKATDYVAPEQEDQVIAHSKVLGGGEKTTIEFSVPEPGTYPFLCSFPGHVALMKGVLVAE